MVNSEQPQPYLPQGAMLRAGRKRAGLTLAAAAVAAGASSSYLGCVERGASRPSRALTERLVNALGLVGEERARVLAGALDPLAHPWRRSFSPRGPYPQGLAPVVRPSSPGPAPSQGR